jgi:hypothetical protein
MGDQLQTTECPSYVLDHISTDDSVTTFFIDRGVRGFSDFADIGNTFLSRAPFFGGPEFTAARLPLVLHW